MRWSILGTIIFFGMFSWAQEELGEFSFNATTSFIHVPAHPSLEIRQALTLEAWVRVQRFEDENWKNPIISKHGEASGWELRVGNRTPTFMVTLAGEHYEISTTPFLEPWKWYYIVGTFDGQNLSIYVNTELMSINSVSSSQKITQYTGPLYLGKNPNWPERKFEGKLGETRIWNRALSASEIRSFYNRSRALYLREDSPKTAEEMKVLQFLLEAKEEIKVSEKRRQVEMGEQYELSSDLKEHYRWYKNEQGESFLLEEIGHPDYLFKNGEQEISYIFNLTSIQSMKITWDSMRTKVLGVTFFEEAGKQFGDFTEKHLRRFLAILFEGRVISVPIIQTRIGRECIVTGLSEEEIKKLKGIWENISSQTTANVLTAEEAKKQKGLVLYYNFQEIKGGRIVDLSSNELHGEAK